MKTFRLTTIIALSLTLILTSCSVEKRHYTKGYNVDWNAKAPKTTDKETAKPAENTIEDAPQQSAINTAEPVKETAPVATQTAAKSHVKKEHKQNAVAHKADDNQSASTGDDIDTKGTAKPYEFKVKDGADVARVQAKPLAFLSKISKAAEGNDILPF